MYFLSDESARTTSNLTKKVVHTTNNLHTHASYILQVICRVSNAPSMIFIVVCIVQGQHAGIVFIQVTSPSNAANYISRIIGCILDLFHTECVITRCSANIQATDNIFFLSTPLLYSHFPFIQFKMSDIVAPFSYIAIIFSFTCTFSSHLRVQDSHVHYYFNDSFNHHKGLRHFSFFLSTKICLSHFFPQLCKIK